ncbi:SDR family NAD(P)-dependent oxidoreductase [Demequina flava]|uniref:SDR family NAD(P)-dependent oxidoreductase n=1 Tax=Demequina flava TaxID=1095025 RepID=UPI00078544B9|nr:SDR family oxidoreductase [Demequina flava]
MSSEFEGLVAVVTGGASGIGLATAHELASRGASIAVLDVNPAVDEPWLAVEADVTDTESVTAAIETVANELGGVDILINNAGIGAVGSVEGLDDAQWARVFDVNVTGMARVTSAALPWLRQSSHAAVVNTCSIAAMNGLPDRALYSASKGAVMSLTLAMATDHVREGIRVNCVSPGTVSTPWIGRLLEQADDPVAERAALDARQATGKMVEPEEVARAIAYLASPLSVSTAGTILDVDGGVTRLRMRPAKD